MKLYDDHIIAELTTTARVGFHQYTFQQSSEAHIILDLMHGNYNYDNKNVWTFVRIENDSLITGYRQTTGWAKTRTVYFAMSFLKSFKSYGDKDFTKKEVYKDDQFSTTVDQPCIVLIKMQIRPNQLYIWQTQRNF